MVELERHLVAVEGATLEVFAGGAGQPVVGTTHPFYVAPPSRPDLLDETPCLVRVYPRGVRGSSPAGAPHERTMDQTIADLEAVRRWWGAARWVFAGASAGGFLGLRYALRDPESLAGLILHACAASLDYFEDPGRGAPLPDWHKGPDGRWVYTGEQEAPCGAWRKDMEDFDVRAQLGALRVPTLVLCGRHDQIIAPGSCTASSRAGTTWRRPTRRPTAPRCNASSPSACRPRAWGSARWRWPRHSGRWPPGRAR